MSSGDGSAGSDVASHDVELAVMELRQYTLHDARRDVLIDLFDRELVETQEAVGMGVLGQFRDLDDPNRFVWMRAFPDMAARQKALTAFYDGPVWARHGTAAAATMIDSDDVLLLRPFGADCAIAPNAPRRPPPGATGNGPGLVAATVVLLDRDQRSGRPIGRTIRAALSAAQVPLLGFYETEPAENTYPRLPVRGDDSAIVWFAAYADEDTHRRATAAITTHPSWSATVEPLLQRPVVHQTTTLRLIPTARSSLVGAGP